MILLYLSIFSFLVYIPIIIDGYDLPKVLYLSILSCIMAFSLLRKKQFIYPKIISCLILIYLSFSFLAYFRSLSTYSFYQYFSIDLIGFVIYFYVINTIKNVDQIYKLIRLVVLTLAISTLTYLYAKQLTGFHFSSMGNEGFFFSLLAASIPLAIYLVIYNLNSCNTNLNLRSLFENKMTMKNEIAIILYIFYILFASKLLFTSNADAPKIAFLLSASLIGFYYLSRIITFKYSVILLWALILASTTFFSNYFYQHFNLDFARKYSWQVAYNTIIGEHTYLIGIGKGNAEHIYYKYAGSVDKVILNEAVGQGINQGSRMNDMHNDYIKLFIETGIGSIFYVVAIFYHIYLVILKINDCAAQLLIKIVLATSLFIILFWGIFWWPFSLSTHVMYIWLMCGLIYVQSKSNKTYIPSSISKPVNFWNWKPFQAIC